LAPKEILLEFIGRECFVLADSHVGTAEDRENDLFRGLR
jgi:hypothetical protein